MTKPRLWWNSENLTMTWLWLLKDERSSKCLKKERSSNVWKAKRSSDDKEVTAVPSAGWAWASARSIYRFLWFPCIIFWQNLLPSVFLQFSLTSPLWAGLLWSSYHTWNILYWRKGAGGRDDNDNDDDIDDDNDVDDSDDDDDDAGVFPSAILGFYCFWWRCFCRLPLHIGIPRLAGICICFTFIICVFFFLSTSAYLDWQVQSYNAGISGVWTKLLIAHSDNTHFSIVEREMGFEFQSPPRQYWHKSYFLMIYCVLQDDPIITSVKVSLSFIENIMHKLLAVFC